MLDDRVPSLSLLFGQTLPKTGFLGHSIRDDAPCRLALIENLWQSENSMYLTFEINSVKPG